MRKFTYNGQIILNVYSSPIVTNKWMCARFSTLSQVLEFVIKSSDRYGVLNDPSKNVIQCQRPCRHRSNRCLSYRVSFSFRASLSRNLLCSFEMSKSLLSIQAILRVSACCSRESESLQYFSECPNQQAYELHFLMIQRSHEPHLG